MSESLTFLVADLSRMMRRIFNARAREIGITRTQWRTLTLLSRHEGCNQGMLAELLEVEPITVARMVDRLQDAALIERRADPNDRRAWLLYLTPQARDIVVQLRALIDELTAEVIEGVSPDSIAQLRAALEVMRSNASALSQSGPATNSKLSRSTPKRAKAEKDLANG